MAFGLTKSLDLESGSSQYASISDASQTGLDITGDMTVEAWIKLESTPSSGARYRIAEKYVTTSNQRAWWLDYHNNGGTPRINFRFGSDGEGGDDHAINQTLTIDTWYHVAVVVDVSLHSVEFFVDGVSIGTDATGTHTSIYNSSAPFVIGAQDQSGGAKYFDGKISLVRIWDDMRTAVQINGNKCKVLGSSTNLQGEWTLDDVYTDGSGNSNTLTASSSPVFATDVTSDCAGSGSTANANFLKFM